MASETSFTWMIDTVARAGPPTCPFEMFAAAIRNGSFTFRFETVREHRAEVGFEPIPALGDHLTAHLRP